MILNNFFQRTITGAVFLVVMIGCIWYSFWSMAALFLVISVLGLWEFYSLVEKANVHLQKYLGIFSSMIFFVLFSLFSISIYEEVFGSFKFINFIVIIAMIPISFLFFSIMELFRQKGNPLSNISISVVGILYVVFPFSFLQIIAYHINENITPEYDSHLLLGYFFLIWSNDTFAYLVGRAIGKRKLLERISPKKTWEGFIGGIILTQGVAYIISLYFTELTMMQWFIVAAIVSVTGTLGDLVESMFKRSLGVKDSGTIFPGHGGILDRFDAVLLSSPFVVTYLLLIR